MKKETLYKLSIGLLLLLNVLQLAGRFLHHRGQAPNRNKVVQHLQLDANQEEAFFALVNEHRTSMMALQKEQQQYTQAYFYEASDSMLQNILKVQEQKVKVTAAHFDRIKAILHKDQYPHFETFKKRAVHHILRATPPRKPLRQNPKRHDK